MPYIYTKIIVNQRFNIVNSNDSSFYNSNFKAVFKFLLSN
nr:MAG TPA: hypothetical protein [Caudoviricetes sp.]